MEARTASFLNDEGEELAAILDLPIAGSPRAFAIFAHCFTCSKDLRAAKTIGRELTAHGIGVLRFDFTGLGQSEGEFSDTTFSSNIADIASAADWLEEDYEAPKILIGHSLGGAAVIRAAASIPSVAAVATIGAPASPKHVENLLDGSLEDLEETGEATVDIGGRPFRIRRRFIEDLRDVSEDDEKGQPGVPLLILHSPADTVVGIENARMIYEAARHPKSFVSLDDADHLLTDRSDSQYAATVIASWAARYVGAEVEPEPPEPGERRVATRTGRERFHTEIWARGHSLVADEPLSQGGGDDGPTAYDLLLAALGSCTSITLRMYADRKEWPVEAIGVRLRHERIHAKDCEECESKEGRISRIERDIELEGDLTQEQKERLLYIADRCPVHKTLTGEIVVKTKLVEPGRA